MIVVPRKTRILRGMKFVLAILGAGIFLFGCGGGDDGDKQTLSTTTIDTGGGTTKKPKPGPVEYKSLIERRGDKPVITGTNKAYRFYYFKEGTKRFTGIAKKNWTNGFVTLYRIEHGLKDGYAVTLFPKSTNHFQRVRFEKGLKNGKEFVWHPNYKLKTQGQWTNGVKTGPWFRWNEDGTTNLVAHYLNGKYLGRDKRFLPEGMLRTWEANALGTFYTGKPQAIILKAFGTPTQAKGPNWIYKGMKVTRAIPGKVATTVTFTIQSGKVAAVRVSE